ncbi:hypothetical protein RND71_005224 [Anisodus tanguticus]|uniref:DUF4283 domain-containing protein n=1 Tax=Anisodus tanguticus TaxID=243964 RepID=A0AAE1SR45_9SOLA|nr:hypothetical protein RND71_005224 [Anisodus tanguticus]
MKIQKWTTKFRTDEESTLAPVWINLPWDYYVWNALCRIIEPIGNPIVMDKATTSKTRPSTAKLRVEIDLTKPLLHELTVEIRNPTGELETVVQKIRVDRRSGRGNNNNNKGNKYTGNQAEPNSNGTRSNNRLNQLQNQEENEESGQSNDTNAIIDPEPPDGDNENKIMDTEMFMECVEDDNLSSNSNDEVIRIQNQDYGFHEEPRIIADIDNFGLAKNLAAKNCSGRESYWHAFLFIIKVTKRGFSIGAAKATNVSLVIGPGAGYNLHYYACNHAVQLSGGFVIILEHLKSNPLPEEEKLTSTRNNGEPKRQNIFQERLRAEQSRLELFSSPSELALTRGGSGYLGIMLKMHSTSVDSEIGSWWPRLEGLCHGSIESVLEILVTKDSLLEFGGVLSNTAEAKPEFEADEFGIVIL